jgi:hypothetical protein
MTYCSSVRSEKRGIWRFADLAEHLTICLCASETLMLQRLEFFAKGCGRKGTAVLQVVWEVEVG